MLCTSGELSGPVMAVQDKLAPPGLNTAPARLHESQNSVYLRAEAVDKRAMLVRKQFCIFSSHSPITLIFYPISSLQSSSQVLFFYILHDVAWAKCARTCAKAQHRTAPPQQHPRLHTEYLSMYVHKTCC